MKFSAEGIYTLSYMAGATTTVKGVPFPLETNKDMSYKQMIDIGMEELEELGLLEDGKPNETCDGHVVMMSEYHYSKSHVFINGLWCATGGGIEELCTVIAEEEEENQYELTSLLKVVLMAKFMIDYEFLLHLGPQTSAKWKAASLVDFLSENSNEESITVERIVEGKLTYQSSFLADIDEGYVVEFSYVTNMKRVMSSTAAVAVISKLLEIKKPEELKSFMKEQRGDMDGIEDKY